MIEVGPAIKVERVIGGAPTMTVHHDHPTKANVRSCPAKTTDTMKTTILDINQTTGMREIASTVPALDLTLDLDVE